MRTKIIEIKNLYKSFEKIPVLQGVDLELYEGEILSILGESGCGKSTLLGVIAGFYGIDKGEIWIEKKLVANQESCLPPKSRGVGVMFQDYALFPHLSVYENIQFGLTSLKKEEQRERIFALLEILGLMGLENRYPHELSGGQAQRVALARCLAPRPKIILFDEPFSNLNQTLSIKMREEVKQIVCEYRISAIFVTHHKEDAFCLSDRIALVQNGEIFEVGAPRELYETPKTLQSARFLGVVNCIEDFTTIKNNAFRSWLEQKRGIFRPKDLALCEEAEICAEVIENRFFGDWVEVIVRVDGYLISLQLQQPLECGALVYLRIC